jgi:hypothetical protein
MMRWVASRKAALIRAIDAGELSLENACAEHALSIEEFFVAHRAAQFRAAWSADHQAAALRRPPRAPAQAEVADKEMIDPMALLPPIP